MRNKYKKFVIGLSTSVFFVPFMALAQTNHLDEILYSIKIRILGPLVALMAIVALIVFAWGIIEWIYGADNDEKVAQGKRHVVYGIIGLSIMFGVWALLNTICIFIGAC